MDAKLTNYGRFSVQDFWFSTYSFSGVLMGYSPAINAAGFLDTAALNEYTNKIIFELLK
jgi:hypothetical protein